MNKNEPCIIEETDEYAVVYKPAKMHSTPLNKKENENLLDWCRERISPVYDLMHRLDYETNGLVLIAKSQKSFDFFKSCQRNGSFVKEYSLLTCRKDNAINEKAGFPPPPFTAVSDYAPENPLIIESYFRPFGKGRKEVRPVINDGKKHREVAKDGGSFYKTHVICKNENLFTVRLFRGFRHQIRCHFFWIGYPILNDPVYNADGSTASGSLALRAHALFFPDPKTGEQREYRVESLGNKDFITS